MCKRFAQIRKLSFECETIFVLKAFLKKRIKKPLGFEMIVV